MKMDLTAERGWRDGIRRVGRWVLACSILLLMASQAASAQKSVTAQSMERQGMVDVTTLDSTIHVSLMYARPDNFTGRILYADLREALLHPRAARALCEAQRLLKKRRPDLSLKIYDATRPMSVQAQMWQVVVGTPQQNYVSNPRNGGGLHNYGMAVDVTLCDAKQIKIHRYAPLASVNFLLIVTNFGKFHKRQSPINAENREPFGSLSVIHRIRRRKHCSRILRRRMKQQRDSNGSSPPH